MITPEQAARFWKKVAIIPWGFDKCWNWQGSVGRNGYGKYKLCRKTFSAHRLAYEISSGEHPGSAYVLHSCDNPPCCNPKHLRLGTHIENMQDMVTRGRARRGKGEGRA